MNEHINHTRWGDRDGVIRDRGLFLRDPFKPGVAVLPGATVASRPIFS